MPQTLAFMKQEAHPHHVIWTLFANKYGGIYRLEIPGHRFVVVNDPALLPAIIGRPGLPKWAAYQNVVPLVAKSKVETLFTTPHSSDPMWKTVRKALNPAFSPSAIKSKFGLVVEKCWALCDWLEQMGPGADVEAQDAMARLTLDVVLMAGFGIASNTIGDPAPVPLLTELHYAMDETFSKPVRAVLLKLLPFLPAAKEREVHFARLYGIWDGWVQQMLARGPPPETDDSLWACITRVRNPSTGRPMEGDKLQAEVASLIVGGLDTTAQTCSFTLALLATHPAAQRAVAAELQKAGLLATPAQKIPRQLTYADLSRLPYLDAVVKESMRMFPVSASGLGRYTTEPTILGGYLIPAGTEVQINYYAMQNIEANFPEPHRFLPERWLGHARAAASPDASTDGFVEGDPLARAFLPYSAGPRSCIGQPLAQMEVPTILATVLGRFEVELADQMGGYEGMLARQINAFTLSLKGGCHLKFRARASM
ncbi:Cytochrome P450 4e2 [Coccomyxa sp. Obi]|nr:Cytochrome P450 4e2 [Coccomyxa sp. Obi]